MKCFNQCSALMKYKCVLKWKRKDKWSYKLYENVFHEMEKKNENNVCFSLFTSSLPHTNRKTQAFRLYYLAVYSTKICSFSCKQWQFFLNSSVAQATVCFYQRINRISLKMSINAINLIILTTVLNFQCHFLQTGSTFSFWKKRYISPWCFILIKFNRWVLALQVIDNPQSFVTLVKNDKPVN